MRFYLTGFMGAGKTAVGKHLSSALGYRFVDLDEAIEAQAGMSVREIFEVRREPFFRALESACLRRTERSQNTVVATGGGTVTFEQNRDLIRRLGVSIWLNPSFDLIVARIGAEGKTARPLLRSPEQARALYQRRLPAYRTADLRVDLRPDETPAAIAARIVLLLRERRCAI